MSQNVQSLVLDGHEILVDKIVHQQIKGAKEIFIISHQGRKEKGFVRFGDDGCEVVIHRGAKEPYGENVGVLRLRYHR